MIAGHVAGPIPEVRRHRRDVSLGVERAISQSLAKEAADRFATAADFTQALSIAITLEGMRADERREARRRRVRQLAGAAAVTVTAFGGWWLTDVLAGPSIETIAVLPASNLTRDPEQDYFVDGVYEALVTELTRAGISIKARQSVLRFRDTELSLREIAEELVVDALIQLSVGWEADSVVVDVSLYDGDSELALWSGSFSARFTGILRLYRDVSRRIAEQIGLVLSDEAEARLAESPVVDERVVQDYWLGSAELRRFTGPSLVTALDYFESALGVDPDHAPSHVGIASVWSFRIQLGITSPEEGRGPLEEHLNLALDLDPGLAKAHMLRANQLVWVDWDWDAGEREFLRAIELDPNDAQTRAFYGHLLTILGRFDEAEEQGRLALELDRGDPFVDGLYGTQLMLSGHTEDAMTFIEVMREEHPGQGFGRSNLADAYHALGRCDEEIALRIEIADSRGEEDIVAALNRGFQEGGCPAAFARVADTLVVRSRQGFVRRMTIARFYAMGGETESALEWVDSAVVQRERNVPYIGVADAFADLHDNPRFRELARQLGVPIMPREGG